jgi:hypothetical protein
MKTNSATMTGKELLARILRDETRGIDLDPYEVKAFTAVLNLLENIEVGARVGNGARCAITGNIEVGELMTLGFNVPAPNKR